MFSSTRSNIKTTSSEAIIKGLSVDGGLFVIDKFDPSFFNKELLGLGYNELAVKILDTLLDDFTLEEVKSVVKNSYNQKNFRNEIVTIKDFHNHSYLELFNGNTFAFKDMALSVLPNLFAQAKKIQNLKKKTIILTATSGDTGSAALNGFSELEDTYVIVLYPTKGVSEFQELQMNAYQSEKHIVLAVDGNFDDCQRIVKTVFQNEHPKNVSLSSANSINIGRILPQIIYYVFSYLELVRREKISYNEKINITVPTGNFGNIYAAYIAKRLGTPINKLIIASNENYVLTELFNKNIYNTKMKLKQTISPSMDILVSSNVERYLYEMENHNKDNVKKHMDSLTKNGIITIDTINKNKDFYAYFSQEEETYKEIKNTFYENDYLIDPHTAVAKSVSRKYMKETNDDTYMLIVSTANPYKFNDAILKSLNLSKDGSLLEKFKRIEYYTKTQIDPRMKEILTKNHKKINLPLNETLSYVTKIIGEIDDQN